MLSEPLTLAAGAVVQRRPLAARAHAACRLLGGMALVVAGTATALHSVHSARRTLALSLAARMPTGGDITDVSMQCVSEFNWNQGQEATFKSATGYFVGMDGRLESSDVPDCGGSWTAEGDVLTLKGNKQPRMFLKDGRDRLLMFDMRTEELSWTQNVRDLGRDLNGAVYATWVRSEDEASPANAARLYCDANDGTGNNLWCPEMDFGEANACGFRSTSHPVTDLNPGHDWRSNAVNCYVPLGTKMETNLFYCGLGIDGAQSTGAAPAQTWVDHYGNALMFTSASAHPPCAAGAPDSALQCSYGIGESINTDRDVDVRVRFHFDGHLRGFTTTLRQGSNIVELERQTSPNSFSVPVDNGFPDSGRMALLVQLWMSRPGSGTEGDEMGGSGMSWLSGTTCDALNGEDGLPAVSEATYTIKDMRITNSRTGAQRRVLFRNQK